MIRAAAAALYAVFPIAAFAAAQDLPPIPVDDGCTLTFAHTGSYNWGDVYRVGMRCANGEWPLVMDDLDGQAKLTSSDNVIGVTSADQVHYDAKRHLLSIDSEFSAGSWDHRTYQLASEQTNGKTAYHLLLQSDRTTELDGQSGVEKITRNWRRPKGS